MRGTRHITAWVEAFNLHDAQSLAKGFHETGSIVLTPLEYSLKGREAIRRYFEELFVSFPDVHVRVTKLLGNADSLALEWVQTGTLQREYFDFPPTGKSFVLSGSWFFELGEGHILVQRSYWDKISFFRQIMSVSL